MVRNKSDKLWPIALAAGAVMVLVGFLAYVVLGQVSPDDAGKEALGEVLTNLAAVGSITAGFSLAAFAAFISNTRAMEILAKHYGAGVRSIVILGQGTAVLTALVCAVSRGLPDPYTLRVVASCATGTLAATVVITVLLMNSMLGWQGKQEFLS